MPESRFLVLLLLLLLLLLMLTVLLYLTVGSALLVRTAQVSLVGAAELSLQPGLHTYFNAYTRADCKARSCGSADACRRAYLALVLEQPPTSLVETLVRDVVSADKLCRERAPFLSSIPWRVAILESSAENGWPHTHGNVVCLPTGHFARPEKERVETMVHERVHVFQRARPEETRRMLGSKREVEVPVHIRAMARSNPDLDGRVYADRSGHARIMIYNNDSPRDLSDARIAVFDVAGWKEIGGEDEYEHPLEEMAYRVAREVAKS